LFERNYDKTRHRSLLNYNSTWRREILTKSTLGNEKTLQIIRLSRLKPELECTKQERFSANSPASEGFTAGNSVATTSLLDIKPGGFGDATFCSIFATSREKFDLFTENFAPLVCIFLTFSSHFPQVSWIRKRDLHILTTGASSYTSDQRFQVTND
jgi:hypothetical protein